MPVSPRIEERRARLNADERRGRGAKDEPMGAKRVEGRNEIVADGAVYRISVQKRISRSSNKAEDLPDEGFFVLPPADARRVCGLEDGRREELETQARDER